MLEYSLEKVALFYKKVFPSQDTCQGVTQVVVAIAENHAKIILDCASGQDENRKTDVMKLVQLALVRNETFTKYCITLLFQRDMNVK